MVWRTNRSKHTPERVGRRAVSPPLLWTFGFFIAVLTVVVIAKSSFDGSHGARGAGETNARQAGGLTPLTLIDGDQTGRSQAHVFAAQRASYAVFRSPAETPPSAVLARLSDVLEVPRRTLDATSAQLLRSPLGGLWIVNGRQGVTCIVQAEGLGLTCSATRDFLRRGLSLGVFAAPPSEQVLPESFLLLGVAPDWVRGVNLRIGALSQTQPVVNNIYARRAAVPVMVAGLEGEEGKRSRSKHR